MRKQIVGLGAAVAVMAGGGGGGGAKGDPRDWDKRGSAGAEAMMQLPIILQGTIVAKKFAHAKTIEQFSAADAIWITLRPNIAKYETSLSCKDYGQSHDNEVAVDLVGDLIKKPVGLWLDVGKFVLSVAGQEKDAALDALKDATKELIKLGTEKGVEKALESAAGRKIVEAFKESLLKYLQSKSRRSRKYFLQVISDIGSVAKAYGGLAIKAGDVALTPSRINPDECGFEQWIEHERESALRRVFSSPSINRI